MNQPIIKACTRCGLELPLERFSTDRSRADGLSKWCKKCVSENSRKHYQANREKTLARQAAQRAADPEHFSEISRASQAKNRERHNAYNRQRYQAKRVEILAKNRWIHMARKFGITPDSFAAILNGQGGVCAICGRADEVRWSVDHDHSCCPGKVTCGKCIRGILCHQCNAGIGFLRDDPNLCERAASYLHGK